jgi:phenylpropionate dioxygenase-like ring-hydroxylating dioxygenase large terminal subunit
MLDSLREAIARQRPGWSLEQQFYTCPEIFDFERRGWLAEQWFILGHCSEVPETGSFIVRSLLGESLLVVRDANRTLRGFYNVCRHRGSRICERDGRVTSFVCPYHAWSYRLDGTLRTAPAMSEQIDASRLALNRVSIREIGGIILGSLKGDPQSLDALAVEAEPMMRYQGIAQARIAARRSYPTNANWKLVMENFSECYHCVPAHPEYCDVMKHVDVVARMPTAEEAETWQRAVERWAREDADPDAPGSQWTLDYTFKAKNYDISRDPIGGARKTASKDGEPVAPLMGQFTRFDGGVSSFTLSPFVYIGMANDHAVMFQFLPLACESTDVIITWLVNGSAGASEVDVERMIWMWDVTTIQDKAIIERNAQGVRSLAYQPGPYSATLERGPAGLVSHYLDAISLKCGPSSGGA